MKLAVKYLHKALVTKIEGLGYRTQGAFPYVEIYSFDETPGGNKEDDYFEVTCIVEPISNSLDPSESLNMLEAIRTGITTLTLDEYRCFGIYFEQHTPQHEAGEADLNIWRQTQRVRFHLELK